MDEEIRINECPWPVEQIPSTDFLSRHISTIHLPKDSVTKRRFPSEASFSLHPGENGLSKYWNKYISLRDIYITIGISHNAKQEFKNFTGFKIFQIEKGYIENLSKDILVEHDPSYNGDPAPVGKPNNRSHSLVKFFSEEDLLEIRLGLADYCRENYEISYRHFDVNSVQSEVEELRRKMSDTPYHRITC